MTSRVLVALCVTLSGLFAASGCAAQTGIFAAGSRHLYLRCTGDRHGPAVILEAGLFRDSTDWRLVQPQVAQLCSFDREGLGKSVIDTGASPETECLDEQVEDVRRLLRTAHVEPLYLLVGHSAGGLHVRRFTRDHEAEVMGLVFLDSAHEEQIWRFQAIDPASVQGPPADPKRARCGGGLPTPGERLVWRTDLPLIVLRHGIPLTFEGSLATHTAEFNEAVDAMAKDLTARSSKGELRIAPHSGHDIMFDEPELVVRAIQDVWKAAGRGGGGL